MLGVSDLCPRPADSSTAWSIDGRRPLQSLVALHTAAAQDLLVVTCLGGARRSTRLRELLAYPNDKKTEETASVTRSEHRARQPQAITKKSWQKQHPSKNHDAKDTTKMRDGI